MKCSKELYNHCLEEVELDKEKTSFQIRIFDDETGSVTYKYLSSGELHNILKILDENKNKPLEWM